MLKLPIKIGHKKKGGVKMNNDQNPGTAPTGGQPAAPAQAQPAQPAQPVQPAQPAPAAQATPQPTPAAPTEQADRTKEQFDKLLESNRRLFEANELLRQEMQRRSVVNQTFAPVNQPTPQPAQTQVNPEDFYEIDPDSGEKYINEQKLKARLDEVNERATRAEQSVQSYIRSTEEKESVRQNQEAFSSYPELNPSNEKFDLEFHKQTRALIYDSLINPQDYGGRPLEFKEAADRAKSRGVSATIMNQSEVVDNPTVPQPAASDESQKEQASLQANAQPSAQAVSSISQEASLEELRRKTRESSGEEGIWAVAQRLQNVDHVGTPTNSTEE